MKNGKGKGKGGSRPGSDVVYPDFLSAIKGKGNEIVDKLSRADVYNIFAEPVDPNEVVGYLTIIKSPMDLGTVRQKLESGKYSSLVSHHISDCLRKRAPVCKKDKVLNPGARFILLRRIILRRMLT